MSGPGERGQGPDWHAGLMASHPMAWDFVLSVMEANTYSTGRLHCQINLLEMAEVWVGG